MALNNNRIIISMILDFIKGGGMQPSSKPGFAHALKLSYNLIAKERLQWTASNKLTYRYKLAVDDDSQPQQQQPSLAAGSLADIRKPFTTGLLVAIMDELTTNACFGVGKPSAPGLSLQMQMELTPLGSHYCASASSNYAATTPSNTDSLTELDVVSTVMKLGRKISFVKSDFYDPTNQQLIAFGSHVKYMPSGSYIMDLVFNKSWAWNLYANCAGLRSSSKRPEDYTEKDLWKEVIGKHLEYEGLGKATFHITREHMNPMGSLHGGCHAILMEMVGETVAREHGSVVVLESMQIDYISASRGTVKIVTESLSPLQMKVGIYSAEHGRLMSEGKLRWSLITGTKSRL